MLGDRVWNDLNVNGVQDIGEPQCGWAGCDLLAGCTGTTVLQSRTTNASGSYTFANIAAGQYRIRVTAPGGFAFTLQDAIDDDDYDSDMNSTGFSSCITISATEENYRIDAGITQGALPTPTNTPPPIPPTATFTPTPILPTATPTLAATPTPSGNGIVGNSVWTDTNANGIQDIGERGVAGVTVELLVGCTGTTVGAHRAPAMPTVIISLLRSPLVNIAYVS